MKYLLFVIFFILIIYGKSDISTKPIAFHFRFATTDLFVGDAEDLFESNYPDNVIDYAHLENYDIYFGKPSRFNMSVRIDKNLDITENLTVTTVVAQNVQVQNLDAANAPVNTEFLNSSESVGNSTMSEKKTSTLSCSLGKKVLSGTCSWIPNETNLAYIQSHNGLYTNQFNCSYLINAVTNVDAGSIGIEIICANF